METGLPYQPLAGEAIHAFDKLTQVVQVMAPRLQDVIVRLVDKDALDIQPVDGVIPTPPGVEVDFCACLRQGLVAVVDGQVSDRPDVGERVQPGHLAHVVLAGQWRITGPTVGVHNDKELDIGVGRDPVWSVSRMHGNRGMDMSRGLQGKSEARLVWQRHIRIVQRLPRGLGQWIDVKRHHHGAGHGKLRTRWAVIRNRWEEMGSMLCLSEVRSARF